jgi:hypothetical protein
MGNWTRSAVKFWKESCEYTGTVVEKKGNVM